jgi:hypothetical protein
MSTSSLRCAGGSYIADVHHPQWQGAIHVQRQPIMPLLPGSSNEHKPTAQLKCVTALVRHSALEVRCKLYFTNNWQGFQVAFYPGSPSLACSGVLCRDKYNCFVNRGPPGSFLPVAIHHVCPIRSNSCKCWSPDFCRCLSKLAACR